MRQKQINWIWLTIILALVITITQVDSCRKNEIRAQQGKIDSLTVANQQLITIKNKVGENVVRQEPIIVSSDADQAELLRRQKEIFKLKDKDQKNIRRINTLIQMNNNIVLENSFLAKYIDTLERRKFSPGLEDSCKEVIKYYTDSSVLVGTSIKYDSAYLQIRGTIQKDGVKIDSLNFPDIETISIEETKGGFFRRGLNGKVKLWTPRKTVISVHHTNQYIQTQNMSSIEYKRPGAKWVDRGIAFSAGVVAGLILIL